MSVESVIWSSLWFVGKGYLELCVPCLYRLWLWTEVTTIVDQFRGSLPFWVMFLSVLGWTEREIWEDLNSPNPNKVRNNNQTHGSPSPSIVSWTLNFLFPPEWSERTKSDSQACKEEAAFKDQVDCKYRPENTQKTLKTACFSCCHETRQIKIRHLCSKTECGIISCRLGFTGILQDSPSLVFLLPSVWMCIWFPLQILTWLK